MNKVPFNTQSLAIAATGMVSVVVGKADQYLVYVPGVASCFASSAVKLTLEGSYSSGTSARTMYWYNYVSATPAECVATISTGGVYELPHPGSVDVVRVSFDVALTKAAGITLCTPKTTF